MKTLGEIITDVKDGKKPDYEDLRYAVLALSHLHMFYVQDLLKIHKKTKVDEPFGIKWLTEESFNRSQKVMSTSPRDFVGKEYDPDSSQYQKRREMMRGLVDKIISAEKDDSQDE